MKKIITTFWGAIASLSLKITAMNVNTACMYAMHQPNLPQGIEKLRKF